MTSTANGLSNNEDTDDEAGIESDACLAPSLPVRPTSMMPVYLNIHRFVMQSFHQQV